MSASQRISNVNCMNYDHNKNVGLFEFHSGYRKFYLNSPEGYSGKIINAQAEPRSVTFLRILLLLLGPDTFI